MLLFQFEEIKIAVPWGHLSGKWYGPKDKRPLLGLHGWQDNAGTFDTIAPYLPSQDSFLAIDLPGHGLSSWLPKGVHYNSIHYVALLRELMEDYQWSKVALMGHSMSAINSFVFASLFPDKVDYIICLDALKPLTRSPERIVDVYTERIETAIKLEKRINDKSKPPTYDQNGLVERLRKATNNSINVEACKYLLERNTRPSDDDPQRYYFSRDNRIKTSIFYTLAQDVAIVMANRIKCPHLMIKAKESEYYEDKKYFYEVINILQKKNNFEYHEIDGTHHVHLNEPAKVAQIINAFLKKYTNI